MAVMVTGGTGYIGSYLVRRLLAEGHKVVIFDNAPNMERIADIAGQVEVVVGDVTELAEILNAINRYGVERIAHLAYFISASLTKFPTRGLRINLLGTANMFEAARIAGLRRVVYGSSVTQYGSRSTLDEPEWGEEDVPQPGGPALLYGACKQFDERTAEHYTMIHGLELIGMRLTSIYGLGRGQRQNVAPHFMVLPERAALGEAVVFPPDALMSDWMYAPDAALALHLALFRPLPQHRVFNMASQRAPHGEIRRIVESLLPGARITVGTEVPTTVRLVNSDRLRDELGFVPEYSLEEGYRDYLGRVRAGAGLPAL